MLILSQFTPYALFCLRKFIDFACSHKGTRNTLPRSTALSRNLEQLGYVVKVKALSVTGSHGTRPLYRCGLLFPCFQMVLNGEDLERCRLDTVGAAAAVSPPSLSPPPPPPRAVPHDNRVTGKPKAPPVHNTVISTAHGIHHRS